MHSCRLRLLVGLVFLLLGAVPANAKPFLFRGQSLQLNPIAIEGKDCLSLEDADVRRLIDLTYAQVQFSSTASSVYVYLPGRQSFWSERCETVTVNGLDVAAPGQYFPEKKP